MSMSTTIGGGFEAPVSGQSRFVRAVLPDQRRSTRAAGAVRAFSPDGVEYEVIDVSLGGMRLASDAPLWPGHELELVLNATRQGLVRARARVLSLVPAPRGVAMRVRFEEPSPQLTAFLSRVLDA